MTIIKFRVEGLPPKKNGANSMWGNKHESKRLVLLRREALRAMGGQPCFKNDIMLTVTVCVGAPKNDRSIGDLDTFVSGVCDGLMKADPRCKLCGGVWNEAEEGIRPEKRIAIEDDCKIIGIQAYKMKDASGRRFYDVELEGE